MYEQPVGKIDELAFSGGEQRSSAGPEGDPRGARSALSAWADISICYWWSNAAASHCDGILVPPAFQPLVCGQIVLERNHSLLCRSHSSRAVVRRLLLNTEKAHTIVSYN